MDRNATQTVSATASDIGLESPKWPRLAGRYQIHGTIGSGAFGEVLDAFDEQLHRRVAIKRLKADVQLDSDARARFLREARVLAQLDHPNIVPLLDANLDEGQAFLVMTRVEGQSLSTRLDRGRVACEEAMVIVSEIAKGLAYAHEQGVIHRDIKPSNVLCSSKGRILIADFGLSSAPFVPSLTATGHIVGTLHYMAPETLSGQWEKRSDLYSLGAVLYELLFGTHCFDATDKRELIAKILTETPRYVREPPDSLSRSLHSLLQLLLSKKPGERPATADEVHKWLSAAGNLSASTTSVLPAALAVDTIPIDLEDLEQCVAQLQKAVARDGASLEEVLGPLSLLVKQGSRLAENLCRHPPSGEDSNGAVAADAVLNMLDSVVDLVKATPWRPDVQGLLIQAERSVASPLRALCRSESSTSSFTQAADADFFSFDEPHQEAHDEEYDWLAALTSDEELERYRALTFLLGPSRDAILAQLVASPADCAVALRTLWPMADLLLFEGRSASKPIFDLAIQRTADLRILGLWRKLYHLFKKSGGDYWDPLLVQTSLSDLEREDQRVFGRSFLLHPDERYRRLGLDLVEPHDLWYSIVSDRVPLSWLLEIWSHLRARGARDDFFKIFFSVIYDRLIAALECDPELVFKYLQQFVRINAFLENHYFSRLAKLNEELRRRNKDPRNSGTLDVEEGFTQEMQRFFERPRRQDQPVEGWGSVPLPIQRLLARRGHFQRHFACHPEDLIALEVLRHILVREDILEFLQLFAVNGRLLGEICKEGRLFQHEPAKLALVANPKTPAHVVLKHVGYLRQDSLARLRDTRDCNPLARNWAMKALERKSKR